MESTFRMASSGGLNSSIPNGGLNAPIDEPVNLLLKGKSLQPTLSTAKSFHSIQRNHLNDITLDFDRIAQLEVKIASMEKALYEKDLEISNLKNKSVESAIQIRNLKEELQEKEITIRRLNDLQTSSQSISQRNHSPPRSSNSIRPSNSISVTRSGYNRAHNNQRSTYNTINHVQSRLNRGRLHNDNVQSARRLPRMTENDDISPHFQLQEQLALTTDMLDEIRGIPREGSRDISIQDDYLASLEIPEDASYEQLLELDNNNVKIGIPSFLWQRFPQRKASQNDCNRSCNICLAEFEYSEEIVTLPCLCSFHSHCCLQWLEKEKTCPTCRIDLSDPKLYD